MPLASVGGREAQFDGDDHGCVVGLGDGGRGIGLRPRGAAHRGRGCSSGSATGSGCRSRGRRSSLSLPGERDRHGDGQGGAGRPEAGGDPGLDGDAGVPAPSGRGGPRRPRPDPGRRRGHRAVAERRDRRGAPADPRTSGGWARAWSRSPSAPAARSAARPTSALPLGPIEEACPLGLAPSASTTALMAVGDALALLVSRMRDFRPRTSPSTIRREPGAEAAAGRRRDADRRQLRRARAMRRSATVFVRLAGPRRRSGAVLIEDEAGLCSGSSPTPTSPDSSRSGARPTSTGRSAK